MFRCCVLVAVILMTLSSLTQALIVPQELPSILSLVYSNIPPIRKGTDSRLGFGFRLGEHADFQVVVELGPQKDTQPLGANKNDDDSSNTKRQVNLNDYKKIRRTTTTTTTTTRPYRSTESPNDYAWLRDWFGEWTGTKKKENPQNSSKVQNKNSINEVKRKPYVKTAPMISESSLKQLQQLYKLATMNPIVVEETTPNPSRSENEKLNEIASRLRILSTLQAVPARKTKGEITEELMDVNME